MAKNLMLGDAVLYQQADGLHAVGQGRVSDDWYAARAAPSLEQQADMAEQQRRAEAWAKLRATSERVRGVMKTAREHWYAPYQRLSPEEEARLVDEQFDACKRDQQTNVADLSERQEMRPADVLRAALRRSGKKCEPEQSSPDRRPASEIANAIKASTPYYVLQQPEIEGRSSVINGDQIWLGNRVFLSIEEYEWLRQSRFSHIGTFVGTRDYAAEAERVADPSKVNAARGGAMVEPIFARDFMAGRSGRDVAMPLENKLADPCFNCVRSGNDQYDSDNTCSSCSPWPTKYDWKGMPVSMPISREMFVKDEATRLTEAQDLEQAMQQAGWVGRTLEPRVAAALTMEPQAFSRRVWSLQEE